MKLSTHSLFALQPSIGDPALLSSQKPTQTWKKKIKKDHVNFDVKDGPARPMGGTRES